MEQLERVLEKVYYNPSSAGSYGGVNRLLNEAKKELPSVNREQVVRWLEKQPTYSMFVPTRKKFPRLSTLVKDIDEQWQIDLMDVGWFAEKNRGVKFLLVVIDILSRYAWLVPLESKSQKEVSEAFESILRAGRIPQKVQSDQGKEFKNQTFKALMKKYHIHHFTTTDDSVKCAYVERLNRTLRERIYRYLYHNNTNHYLDALESIISSYNNSYHSSIKMKPSEVTDENSAQIAMMSKEKENVKLGRELNVGDYVRISRKKGVFEKGSTSKWTEEIFKIVKKKKTPKTFIYRLVDLLGEPITSLFYPGELIKVAEPQLYKVEKVIRRRINRVTKEKEAFVKWLGYPDKFNSWIPAE